jgi:hypothetical protein
MLLLQVAELLSVLRALLLLLLALLPVNWWGSHWACRQQTDCMKDQLLLLHVAVAFL